MNDHTIEPRLRNALTVAIVLAVVAACGERSSDSKSSGAPAAAPPAPAASAPPSSAPMAGKAEDVTAKGGTTTGMVGGEAGTVASSGKPESGTQSGGGTGAAQSSGSQTATGK